MDRLDPLNVAWALVDAGEYAKALAAFDALHAGDPECEPILNNRAIVLLCLDRLRDAFDCLRNVDALSRRRKKRSTRTLDSIVAAQWLLGEKDGAVATN